MDNTLEPASAQNLPALIDRARARLAEAKTSAEVLEARQAAELALHYAKLTKAANETQADCLRMIVLAEIRLADEVDAAQERGEVEEKGNAQRIVAVKNDPACVQSLDTGKATLDNIGIDRRRLYEWRKIRDAGMEVVDVAINAALEEGRAPTKSDILKAASLPAKEHEIIAIGEEEIIATANRIKRNNKELGRAMRNDEFSEASSSLPPIAKRHRLYHEDCIGNTRLDPDSVDLIVTDPPYPAEYLHCYDGLGALAARVLKPGGLAVVMVGQSYLPEIIQKLNNHLTYHWTLAYLTPGPSGQQHHRQVHTSWKPVLVYTKGKYKGRWFGDVARSDPNDNDKYYHHWGQTISGMRDLMKRFVWPGYMVLDPFLGGGTTAVVALELGAYFVGFDIDQTAIDATLARIKELSK